MKVQIKPVGIRCNVVFRRLSAPMDMVMPHARSSRTSILTVEGARSIVFISKFSNIVKSHTLKSTRTFISSTIDYQRWMIPYSLCIKNNRLIKHIGRLGVVAVPAAWPFLIYGYSIFITQVIKIIRFRHSATPGSQEVETLLLCPS